jgi:hypothetical protein
MKHFLEIDPGKRKLGIFQLYGTFQEYLPAIARIGEKCQKQRENGVMESTLATVLALTEIVLIEARVLVFSSVRNELWGRLALQISFHAFRKLWNT